MTSCDAHPGNEQLIYVEFGETGDCYYLCSVNELRILADLPTFPPCGHDAKEHSERGTWWMGIPELEAEPVGDYEP